MRHVLHHGRLAPSLQRLVGLLRDTLPIVAEIEEMRIQAERDGNGLDTFAKAAGWYRVLYGDLRSELLYTSVIPLLTFCLYTTRHALDFRLMTEQRVAILDGSHSLFLSGNPPSSLADTKGKKAAHQPSSRKNSLNQGQNDHHHDDETLGLRPIPGFSQIVVDAIRDVTFTAHAPLGKIAPIDVGVVCDVSAVRALGRAIHDRVSARLKS
jgi:mediator of RNA polymerase II transcription subunit 14